MDSFFIYKWIDAIFFNLSILISNKINIDTAQVHIISLVS